MGNVNTVRIYNEYLESYRRYLRMDASTFQYLREKCKYNERIYNEYLESYRRYLRMDASTFQYLREKVTTLVARQNTHLRTAVSAE